MMKGRSNGVETRATSVDFGSYGLKATTAKWVTARQLESARRVILRYLKKGGKMWLRIFPDKPITTKGAEMPMGGGKGAVDHYAFPVKPGRMLFELDGITEAEAKEALKKASFKLPVSTKFVKK